MISLFDLLDDGIPAVFSVSMLLSLLRGSKVVFQSPPRMVYSLLKNLTLSSIVSKKFMSSVLGPRVTVTLPIRALNIKMLPSLSLKLSIMLQLSLREIRIAVPLLLVRELWKNL